MAWQFILTDLSGGVHGEILNADARSVALPHMRVPTASFRIPIWHTWADTVLETDCLVKAYRTDPRSSTRTLAFHGPVVSAEETAGDGQQTLAVTAAGPFWRLSKRLLRKGKSALDWTNTDLATIGGNIIDLVNLDSYTGIGKGSVGSSTVGTYKTPNLKNAAEAINELTLGLNSFEWVVTPVEAVQVGGVGGWPKIGEISFASTIGSSKPDAIFEYGTARANVDSYTRAVTRDGLLTQGIISVQGWPDAPYENKDLIIRPDAAISTRGLFEEQIPDNGIVDDTLRTQITDFALAVRRQPRELITFKPVVNAKPSPFVDYNVGDTVRARAEVRGIVRFDVLFRIWGINFTIDQNGNESVELELVMP